jgi:hypothetical protein
MSRITVEVTSVEIVYSALGFLSDWVMPLAFLFIFGAFFYSIFVLGFKGKSILWDRTPRRQG